MWGIIERDLLVGVGSGQPPRTSHAIRAAACGCNDHAAPAFASCACHYVFRRCHCAATLNFKLSSLIVLLQRSSVASMLTYAASKMADGDADISKLSAL